MQDEMPEIGDQDALTYDIVIATRNRADALSVSIPLMIGQTRPPEKIIVIDSSDDHEIVRRTVMEATEGWSGEVTVENSEPGTPLQRSRGLSLVTADIAFIPDDDSLFFPNAAEKVMAVYERDTEELISGVGTQESTSPPDGIDIGNTWASSDDQLREARFKLIRHALDTRLTILNPRLFIGFKLAEKRPVPDFLDEVNARPTAYLTGFRMSFRRSAIQDVGFDTTLTGYSLDDDTDAAYSATRSGILVTAMDAWIFHHRFPTGRGDGARIGRTGTLNPLYVGLKHAFRPELSAFERRMIRGRLRLFVWLKLLMEISRIRTSFGRMRLKGVWAAFQASRPLWRAGPEDLSAAYSMATETAKNACRTVK